MTNKSFFLLFFLVACGKMDSPQPTDPTKLPEPTPVPTVISSTIHLEKFAKVSSPSALYQNSDNFAADGAVDGSQPAADNIIGFVWRPALINNGELRLEWNSQVNITEIRLFDSPQRGVKVKGGTISFNNSVSNTASAPIDFAELPDDGIQFKSLLGPSEPVTKLILRTTSGDAGAGIGEIVVLGTRVEEEISVANITSYCQLTKYSSIMGGASGCVDGANQAIDCNNGPYRTHKLKDLNESTQWISKGNGAGAYVELECDTAYSISKVEVVDRNPISAGLFGEVTRFSSGRILFKDANKEATFVKPPNSNTASVELPTAVLSKSIRIDSFDGITMNSAAANIGIAELRIFGSHKP